MSTCIEVLRVAFRRSGVLPFGQTLKAPNDAIGMEWLNECFGKWATRGMFGQLTPVFAEGDGAIEAKEQQHITHLTADTVTLPVTFDGDDGKTRKPFDMSLIMLTNSTTGVTTTYVWDAYKAAWLQTNGLTRTDYCPLTSEHDNTIKTLLAVYVASEAGVPIDRALFAEFASAKFALAAKFGRPRRRDVGSYM